MSLNGRRFTTVQRVPYWPDRAVAVPSEGLTMPLPRIRALVLPLIIGVLAWTGTAQAAPAFVQGTSSSTSGTSMTVSYTSGVGAGHLLVGMFRASGTTAVSDPLNGAWTKAVGASDGINSLWYRAGASAGATTVTVSGTSSGSIRAVIAEYSGVATSAPLDGTACNTGTTASATTGSTASVAAGELAFAGVGMFDSPITVTAGAGATLRNQFTGANGTSADEDVASTTAGAQNKSFGLSSAPPGGWAACIATFKPPSAPPPGPFVQGTSNSTSGTTMNVAYPSAVAAGHLLVGMFRASGTTSVSDSRNGAWTKAVGASDGINSVWYRANAAAGTTTVTVGGSASGSIRAVIAEYSGVATTAPLDGTACNTGTTATATTGSTASVPAGELAFAGVGMFDSPITVSAGTGATLRNQFTGANGTSADEDVASTTAGAQNKSFTLSTAPPGGWAACITTFKPPGGVTPPADWVGSFNSGISTSLYPYQSFVTGHVFATADPDGSGRQVADFAINNSDQPYGGSLPRGDLFSWYTGSANPVFTPGKNYFIAIPVRIPAGLPLMTDSAPKFFQWAQIDHPGNDQPSMGLSIGGGEAGYTTNHFAFEMYDNGAFDYPWYGPAVDGHWHTAILSVHFATDNTGSVKLWWDGVPQTFSTGSTTFNGPTLTVSPDGQYHESLDIDSYRAFNAMPGTVTIYHGAPAIGSTYDSVNNTLANPPTGP